MQSSLIKNTDGVDNSRIGFVKQNLSVIHTPLKSYRVSDAKIAFYKTIHFILIVFINFVYRILRLYENRFRKYMLETTFINRGKT